MNQFMIQSILEEQRHYFKLGQMRAIDFRLEQLKKLKAMILKYESEILLALKMDLNKSEFEAYTTEVGFVLDSIAYISKNLEHWSKDKVVKTPLHHSFSKSIIKQEPYGVTLIIAPFNYPFQLLIEPLIGAIAAGNTAVLKPSEYTVHTEAIIIKMFAETFDDMYIKVVTGGRDVTSALISAPFDYIFFTGSVPVGKVVMKAAAENLVPFTLELGGKSPSIVHSDANVKAAAKRIAWGKFMNAGQTCIAPDYVYVHESVEPLFIEEISKNLTEFYGILPINSPDYGRVVNDRHFERLISLIDQSKVVIGGQFDSESRYIAPTVMRNVTWDDEVMKDEIFGPILPVLSYKSLEHVIDVITSRPKPLAFYVFSENESIQEYLLEQISFGGGCVNDTIVHVSSPYLPFGGKGASGIGSYHGEESFKTFSHAKSIMKKSTKFELKLLYPPYKDHVKWIRKVLK